MTKKPTKLQTAIREGLAEQARLESIGVIGFTRPRPKLTPGSLAMPDLVKRDDPDDVDAELLEVIRNAPPPWDSDPDALPTMPLPLNYQSEPPAFEPPSPEAVAVALKKYRAAQSKMRAARREAEALKPAVRDEAFEYWLRRYVVNAESRAEWTVSTDLYQNYCEHAWEQAVNRGDAAVSRLEQVSQTRFGILLREAGFGSERRSRPNGNYYPLRLKQGA